MIARGNSGAHPMWRGPAGAENVDMTVLALEYDRPAREMRMQDLRQRIARNAYEVDPHAVADAIVARLLAMGRPESDDPRG